MSGNPGKVLKGPSSREFELLKLFFEGGFGVAMIIRIALMALAGYLAFRAFRALLVLAFGRSLSRDPNAQKGSRNPYEILGVTPQASLEEIQRAYKTRMAEYHPDKVEHLGEDLQKLAHEKSQEIRWAFDQLSEK